MHRRERVVSVAAFSSSFVKHRLIVVLSVFEVCSPRLLAVPDVRLEDSAGASVALLQSCDWSISGTQPVVRRWTALWERVVFRAPLRNSELFGSFAAFSSRWPVSERRRYL